MRNKKRLLACMLAATMVVTAVPSDVLAQTITETVSTNSISVDVENETSTVEPEERIGINPVAPSDTIRYKKVDVESENIPISTMSVYKDMDYSFLKSFSFGTTYKGEVNLKIITAEKLKESADVRIKEGNVVQTAGFYSEDDGGAGTYKIVDKSSERTISLKNGLYAELIPDTTTIGDKQWVVVSPKQIGIKGDGIVAEQGLVSNTFSIASNVVAQSENVFRGIVYLPKGEYKCNGQLCFSVKDINIVGDGDDTVIFTGNDYLDWYEFFMWGNNCQNLYMGEFKIEARERDMQRYFRQFTFVDSSNVYLYKVNMNIPQETFSMNYYVDKQYTNFTFYSGNKDMTLDNCKMELMCSTFRGANLGVLDFYCRGEENITIMNCEFHGNARDEQIGIFTGVTNRDASFVKNVNFINNKVHTYSPLDENAAGGHRTMCFTVAYDESRNIDGIRIAGNHFFSQVDSKFITFGNADNCVVENNIFELDCTANRGSYIFEAGNLSYGDLVVQNNEVYVTGAGKASVCSGPIVLNNNRFVFDTAGFGHIVFRKGSMENNDMVCMNGGLTNLLNNANICKGNTIETYSGFGGFVQGAEGPNINIEDNIIYNYYRSYRNRRDTTFTALGTLGGSGTEEVLVQGNQYYCPNQYIEESDNDSTQVPIGLFYCRSFKAGKIIAKNNIFQQVKDYKAYDCDMTDRFEFGEDNTVLEYNPFTPKEELYTEVNILNNGENVTEIYTTEDTLNFSTNVTNGARWYSSINAIATVDPEGTVTRKDYGDVVIYCMPTDGSYVPVYDEEGNEISQKPLFGKCVVHFQKAKAEKITVTKQELKMKVGKKYDIIYEVAPKDKVSQEVLWTSSDSNIATVSPDGIITGVGLGEAVITGTTKDASNCTACIKVTIEPTTVYKINLNKDLWDGGDLEMEYGIRFSKGVEVGETLQLEPEYYPDDATDKGISKWVSSNESVATVDQNGLVKTVGPGRAEIIAYSMDGNCSATCMVYVQLEPLKNIKMNVGQNFAIVEWDAIENVDGYRVYEYDETTKLYKQLDWGKKENSRPFWNIEPDKDYEYLITPYLKRRDGNGYDHYYENRGTVVKFHTYKDSVVTDYGEAENKTICVAEGESARYVVQMSKDRYEYRLEDDSVVKLDVADDYGKNAFTFMGLKEGKTNLILTATDDKKYSIKMPIVVTNFAEVTLDLQGGMKAVTAKWEYPKNDIDGFLLTRSWIRNDAGIKLPLDEIEKVTEDGKEKYTYQITGLEDAKEYEVYVKPYVSVDGKDFTGTGGSAKATTIEIVDIDSISASDVVDVEAGQDVELEVWVTPENATNKKLQISVYDEGVAKIKNVINDGVKTTIIISGVTKGSTKLDVLADDNANFLKVVTVNVTSADTSSEEGKTEGTDTPPEEGKTEGTDAPPEDGKTEGTDTPPEEGKTEGTDTPSKGDVTEQEQNTISPVVTFTQVKSYTNKIKLKWKTPSNADGVEIYMYKNKRWKCIANKVAGRTSYTIKKLSAGNAYKLKIRSYVKKDGEILYSEYTALKAVTCPKKVSKVSANIKNKKLTVQWKKQKCDGYEISYSTSGKFKNAKKVYIKKANVQKKVIKDSSFKKNRNYYVRVRAYKSNGKTKYYGKYSTVKKIVFK